MFSMREGMRSLSFAIPCNRDLWQQQWCGGHGSLLPMYDMLAASLHAEQNK